MPTLQTKRSSTAHKNDTRKSSATTPASDQQASPGKARRAVTSPKPKAPAKPSKAAGKSDKNPGGIGDEAVKRATGRDWSEWRGLLNADSAAKMKHADIAVIVRDKYGVGDWWSQMVTVGYEQMVGLREKRQKSDGFSVSGSRVIAVPVDRLFAAFELAAIRRKWLPDTITIRKATPNKSMRIAWSDGKASVSVNFYAKPGGKSNVQVQHDKFASASAAAKMKAYWSARLDALRKLLEAG